MTMDKEEDNGPAGPSLLRSTNGQYERVPRDDGCDDDSMTPPPSESAPLQQQSSQVEPLEVDLVGVVGEESSTDAPQHRDNLLISVNQGITFLILFPTLMGAILVVWNLTGRMWPSVLFSTHSTLALWTSWCLVPSQNASSNSLGLTMMIPSYAMDVLFFGLVYGDVCDGLIRFLLTEPDGTTPIEWTTLVLHLKILRLCGFVVALFRSTTIAIYIGAAFYRWRATSTATTTPRRLPRNCATTLARLEQLNSSWSGVRKHRMRAVFRYALGVLMLWSIVMLVWSVSSVFIHWGSWKAPSQEGELCDPLDTTECCLPFPSFHHMVPDAATDTGWRVNLRGDVLPPLRGGLRIHASFLNQLDGFSTMAPLLFYVDGLKESQQHADEGNVKLQGPSSIPLSVTNRSVTLLVDVAAQTLVPHSAEIDYLDRVRPLVMVFPARPLKHNAHYALAVVNANGLTPTPGMTALFSLNASNTNLQAMERARRYRDVLIPSLATAAPWFPPQYEQNSSSLKLLFDFHTVSAASQLGPVRSVRDATLARVSSPEWGEWSNHVRVIRRNDGVCSRNGTLVARTIHAELEIPWFLEQFGRGHRDAILDDNAVKTGKPVTIGKAKFVVYIPCSVRAAALNGTNATDLRAVLEFGHGLFYHRGEASDGFLLKMANDNGYIIMAMDWRGMSAFDLLVVIKTLMSTPRLFQAVRDNLIQGYANKLALQHFSQNGMHAMDWFHFSSWRDRNRPIPTFNGLPPASIFYGISQGGILGAGYTALSGPTGLIDRGILGVPGTPFALVMTRSREFEGYDHILMLNFYYNRHVRILLSLCQMAWDSVEGSGVLADPITEPFPRMLLQAGLGDAIVPSIAAEALSRALGASTLPGNPRQIYQIPVGHAANESSDGPYVTLTELLYDEEYKTLPANDTFAPSNWVHDCVRRDKAMIHQISEFINTGRIIDICAIDRCFRKNTSTCWDD